MITLIAAMNEEFVIGKDQDIPWKIPGDLRYFKAQTMGKSLILGRKTWDSIPVPLEGRKVIVVTKNEEYTSENATIVHSCGDALELAYSKNFQTESSEGKDIEVIIGGGGEIYKQFIDTASKMILTITKEEVQGDLTYFPYFDLLDWIEIWEECLSEDVRRVCLIRNP